MSEQFDKATYTEIIRRVRDEHMLSLNEIAEELGMSYMGVKRLLDPECKSEIRALTVRKIMSLTNKYPIKD